MLTCRDVSRLVRRGVRQLLISGAATLHLDTVGRWYERRSSRRATVVHVFYMHGTPRTLEAALRAQLQALREQFRLIDFPALARMFDGGIDPGDGRPAALLTFDDGFASNYEVAAPLLEEIGARGVFFVVPQFSMSSGDAARMFYRDRIRDPRGAFQPPMTQAQIRALADRGHTIGNHTLTHAWLAGLAEPDLRREVVDSAAMIEDWTGRAVDAFAWPFRWDAISPAAYRIACDRHRYCFSPCSGRLYLPDASAHLIWRTNLEAHHDARQFRFQRSGLAGPFSALRRRDLARLLMPVTDQRRLRVDTTAADREALTPVAHPERPT